MFKLIIPVTKSVKKENGKLQIEGIASDPTIDRDNERFSTEAIKSMAKYIKEGKVPVRVEHESKVYTDIGTWVDAGVTKDDKLYVKGEVETGLSLGKDIEYLLNKGETLCLSVGGRVFDVGIEVDKDTNTNVRVYKDIMLDEISIVKNPANYNTSLTLAKSVDWNKVESFVKSGKTTEKVPATTVAQQMTQLYKERKLVGIETYEHELLEKSEKEEKGYGGKGKKDKKKPKYMKTMEEWYEEVDKRISEEFGKMFDELCVECEEEEERGLTPEDYAMITKLMNIMASVDLPDDEERPALLDEDDYWMNLKEEMQVVLWDRTMVMPHHNTDYTLNKELLLYQLKKAIDGQGWWKPKDFSAIINHLYRHLKELQLVKSGKMTKEELDSRVAKTTQSGFTTEELALLKKCYEYKKGLTTEQPSVGKGVLSEESINKAASTYELLQGSSINNNLTNNTSIMTKVKKDAETVEETTAPEGEVVEETTEEVEQTEPETDTTVETPEEDTATDVEEEGDVEVEEEGGEEAPEVDAEEAPAEEAPEAPEAPTEEPAAEPAEEAAPATEEVPVDDGEVAKSVQKTSMSVTKLEKSFGQMHTIVKGLVEKAEQVSKLEKSVSDLTETVEKQSEIIEKLASLSTGRKSVATNYAAIEKNFTSSHEVEKSDEEKMDAYMEKGMSAMEAYKQVKLDKQQGE